MNKYVIKDYRKGFEKDQARIGLAVAQNWIWPFAYNLPDLLQISSHPGFDPSTRHYCFMDDEMVGYMFSSVGSDASTAELNFPRMMPGHEQAGELLIERAFEVLRKKGVTRARGRITTMCPDHIRLAAKIEFTIHDWGYKTYYSYEMKRGKLQILDDECKEVDPQKDLDQCARIAARWYNRGSDWCSSLLAEWHAAGLITHSGVWKDGSLIAACMAAPNAIRPETAAIYYIHTPDELSLMSLLGRVVNRCVDYGSGNVIADLINEHRQYEYVYQDLGFKKVADWARCEKHF